MASDSRKIRLPRTSTASATAKAEQFAAKDDQHLRSKAKQAILEELNLQLRVKAEKLKLRARSGLDERENNADLIHGDYIQTPKSPADMRENVAGRTITMATTPSRIPVLRLKEKPTPGQGDVSPRRQARERRRQQSSKVYRPTYDWNRGGRLKEIRIRHLARKFLGIWIQNTFGRVKPTLIRKHYRQTLLRKTFHAWNSVWWTERKEWRLMVRAEYHDRFRMWRQVWSAWKHFVIIERIKNAKKDVATQHGNQKLLSKVLEGWKTYIQMRRSKKALYVKADDRANQNSLKHAWSMWKYELSRRYRQHDMENYAMQHWASGLLQKSWLAWKQKFESKQEEKRKNVAAVLCHEKSLVSRCFYRGWIEYVVLRREKLQKKAYADQVYVEKLQSQCFQHWYSRWYRRRLLAEQGEALDKIAAKISLRRVWNRWKQYIDICDVKRRNQQVADEHYRHHLSRMCFTALHLHRVQRRLQMMRNDMASQLCQKLRQRRAWSLWILRCEETDERKLLPQTRKAHRHYRYKALKQCFQQWSRYIGWRKHRQSQYNLADAHYISKALPKCLFQWRVFVQIMKDKKELTEESTRFRRSILYSKYFYGWLGAYRQSQDDRMMLRMAILHNDKVSVQQAFVKWRNRTRERLHQAEQEEIAKIHYLDQLCKKMFKDWKLYRDESKKGYDLERRAVRHHYLRSTGKSWKAWRQYVENCQRKKSKENKAVAHYSQKISLKVITAWKLYTRQCLNTKKVVEEKVSMHNRHLLRWALWQWYENVKSQVEEQALIDKGDNHWQLVIQTKVLRSWHEYTISHIYKKHCKQQEVIEARLQLDKAKVGRFFQQWVENHKETLREKQQLQKAVEHQKKKLYAKTMKAWTIYKEMAIRKQLLAKQCMWLHNTRILTSYFLQWRKHFQNAEDENAQTAMALWQWSTVLQRKALVSWHEYTREKKRKSQRIAEALDQRRQRLLRAGVSQWLRVATDLSSSRASYAAQQQAKNAYGTMQVVYRCAKHWKEWTKRRKQQPIRSRVTSKLIPIATSVSPVRPTERHSKLSQGLQPVDKFVPGVDTTQKTRPRPRRPDFLVDSLQREGLIETDTDRIERLIEPRKPVQVEANYKQEEEGVQQTMEEEIQPRLEPTPVKLIHTDLHEISSVTDSEFSEVAPKQTALPGYGRAPERIPRKLNYETAIDGERPQQQQRPLVELVELDDREVKMIIPVSLPAMPTKTADGASHGGHASQAPPNRDGQTTPKKDAPVLLPPSAFTIPSPHLPPSPPRLQAGIPLLPSSPPRPQTRLPPSPPRLWQPPTQQQNLSKSPTRRPAPHAATEPTQSHVTSAQTVEHAKSRQSILKEVMQIKQHLQEHQSNVQQLKVLQKQREQLESWIEDQKSGVNISLNMQTDIEQVKGELNMMVVEITELSKKISGKKDKMRELADRANSLIRQIQ